MATCLSWDLPLRATRDLREGHVPSYRFWQCVGYAAQNSMTQFTCRAQGSHETCVWPRSSAPGALLRRIHVPTHFAYFGLKRLCIKVLWGLCTCYMATWSLWTIEDAYRTGALHGRATLGFHPALSTSSWIC